MLTGTAEIDFVKWMEGNGIAERVRGFYLGGPGPKMLEFTKTSVCSIIYWENLPDIFKQALIMEWFFSVGYKAKPAVYIGKGVPTLQGFHYQAIEEANGTYNLQGPVDIFGIPRNKSFINDDPISKGTPEQREAFLKRIEAREWRGREHSEEMVKFIHGTFGVPGDAANNFARETRDYEIWLREFVGATPEIRDVRDMEVDYTDVSKGIKEKQQPGETGTF